MKMMLNGIESRMNQHQPAMGAQSTTLLVPICTQYTYTLFSFDLLMHRRFISAKYLLLLVVGLCIIFDKSTLHLLHPPVCLSDPIVY